MRVLFDTSVVLDVLLNRLPWVQEARVLWQAHDEGQVTGYITATTITNIFYIARRHTDISHAFQAVDLCLQTFEVCSVDLQTLNVARKLSGNDFEDNLQIACAWLAQLDAIVTRDPNGFSSSPLPVYTAAQFRQQLKPNNS